MATALLFAVCASGPLLYALAPHTKTLGGVALPRFDGGSLLQGTLVRELERHLRESSPLTYHVRGVYCETLQRLGWLESARVHYGQRGWWFLTDEQVFPTERFERDGPQRRRTYAWLHGRLERLGVKALAAVVPDKSRVYRDLLAPGASYPASRDRLYALLLTELRDAGFATVDLASLFAERRRVEPAAVLWYAHDTHWNGTGMAHAAAAIVAELRRLGWLDLLGPPQGVRPLQHTFPSIPGDLVPVLGIRSTSDVATTLAEYRDQFASTAPGIVGPVPREQPQARWMLAGTSFSAEGLTALLPILADRVLDALTVRGGSMPVRMLLLALDRIERGEIRPAVVIWELPERQEVEEPWYEIAREHGIR